MNQDEEQHAIESLLASLTRRENECIKETPAERAGKLGRRMAAALRRVMEDPEFYFKHFSG